MVPLVVMLITLPTPPAPALPPLGLPTVLSFSPSLPAPPVPKAMIPFDKVKGAGRIGSVVDPKVWIVPVLEIVMEPALAPIELLLPVVPPSEEA